MSTKVLKSFSIKSTRSLVASLVAASIVTTSLVSVSALSKDYNIVDGDNSVRVTILGNEAYRAIEKAGITLNKNDKVIVDESDPKITNVDIKRAFNINLRVGTENYKLDVTDGTVGDALNQAEIALGSNDIIDIPLDQPVVPGMTVNVDRVLIKEFTEEQVIPFSTETRKTANLFVGEKQTENGENGTKLVTKQEKYVNGILVESKQTGETVTKQAKSQINSVGTKSRSSNKKSIYKAPELTESNGELVDSNGNKVKYKRVLSGTCTGYYGANNRLEGGLRTYTGEKVQRGIVAADLRKFPIGTKLYIPGYGYAVVKDTGGAVKSGRILFDLGFNSNSECMSFGRQTKKVYVL